MLVLLYLLNVVGAGVGGAGGSLHMLCLLFVSVVVVACFFRIVIC